MKLQAYYGKLDAETVARYSLQCALNSYRGQAANRSGDAFVLFNQACPFCDRSVTHKLLSRP